MFQIGLLGHTYWAMLTILWMFAPFLLHFTVIFLDSKKDWKLGLKKSLRHLPLVIPLGNTYRTYQLYEVEYSDPMSIKSVTLIEKLKMAAGQLTLTEAFMVRITRVKFSVFLCSGVWASAAPADPHHPLHWQHWWSPPADQYLHLLPLLGCRRLPCLLHDER